METYEKTRRGAPAGFFAAEAAGLAWLAEPGVIPVVRVLQERRDGLVLEHLAPSSPGPEEARELGRSLAALHDAGAPGFGWTPADTAWFGPLENPFPVEATPREAFAPYWAGDRLRPLLDRARPALDAEAARELEAAIDAIAGGAFDGIAGGPAEQPSRVHGDLWSGNLLWTDNGGVLIDPAAHGGHRLEDLAMLDLFGAPHLGAILAGYREAHPLPEEWREDVPAHQLYGLLAHVALFGVAYLGPTRTAARAVITRARALGA